MAKNIAAIAVRNAAATMKARAKADETPERKGKPIVMSDWLSEQTVQKQDEKGEPIAFDNPALAKHLKSASVTELKDSKDRVTALETEDILASIELASLKLDEKKYDAEYVALSAKTALGRVILVNGTDDMTFETDKNGEFVTNEKGEKKELPSVTKYFNQGFGVLGRNAAAARIRTEVEGPEKAMNSAAKKLSTVWNCSVEEALRRISAAK